MRGPSGTSTDRVTNVPGTPGEKGEKGTKGDKGESGAAGSPGTQGAKGDAGAKGETGAKGDKGDKGDTGDTGPQGPTGATGATGATGPSNVYSGSITFANFLQGSAGTSQSSGNFANLQAGKSYVFDIVIWAYGADENPYLNFSVSTIGASLTLSPIWIRSSSNTFRDNTARTEHAFIGKVAVNGSSVITNFQLAVTVATGFEITSSSKITLTGGYVGQLVGSIS
ncbi:MAG: collagen-like protein [Actinomycetales bacterium]